MNWCAARGRTLAICFPTSSVLNDDVHAIQLPRAGPVSGARCAFERIEVTGGVNRASVLETGQYGSALFAHGIQLGRIQSENLEDRRSDLCRLDESGDGTRLERRIGY